MDRYKRAYRFANLVFEITSTIELEETIKTEMFFVSADECDYRVSVSLTDEVISDFNGCAVCNRNKNEFSLRLNQEKYIKISVLKVFSFLPLHEILFENGMFVLHSSFINFKEDAILFSGDSGVGKTTQAYLWEEYNKAEIINGDRSLIVKEGGEYYAYGWFQSGTSRICKNDCGKVRAVVFLEQGPNNEIYQIKALEAFEKLISQSSYSISNPRHIKYITEIVADMVKCVPIYHYSCRKDQDAVYMLRECLYGK